MLNSALQLNRLQAKSTTASRGSAAPFSCCSTTSCYCRASISPLNRADESLHTTHLAF
ncbi:hypothetical protein C1H46_044469 [Malus baccata]|uniref:Uncharacterized protein n=1 Tax=Malus baccata TaxID=106549 RepID=A0A540K6Z4_MALBA|nr:hypothetical protein C1H46_044469 [Malus baccata]